MNAFMSSRVDYCNRFLTGLPWRTIRQLQLIQNTAAGSWPKPENWAYYQSLGHYIGFPFHFRILLIVWNSHNGLVTKYLADMLVRRHLANITTRSWKKLPKVIRGVPNLAIYYFLCTFLWLLFLKSNFYVKNFELPLTCGV